MKEYLSVQQTADKWGISVRWVNQYILEDDPGLYAGSRLVIRPGFPHCGYMAAHPKEYAEEIEAFMRKASK